MTEIDSPRVPGIGTGVVALVLAVLPLLFIGSFLMLGAVSDSAEVQDSMLRIEPYALPIVGALCIVVALFALWRDTRVGRILALIAITLVLTQAAAIAALIVL